MQTPSLKKFSTYYSCENCAKQESTEEHPSEMWHKLSLFLFFHTDSSCLNCAEQESIEEHPTEMRAPASSRTPAS